jgi:hypothetical protein
LGGERESKPPPVCELVKGMIPRRLVFYLTPADFRRRKQAVKRSSWFPN